MTRPIRVVFDLDDTVTIYDEPPAGEERASYDTLGPGSG